MSVFPISNLPVQTQTWGREVEKRLVNLDASFRSAEINNVTRDSQMMTNYRRLDAALTQLTITNAAADDAQDKAIEALATANTANSTANTANSKAIEALEDAVQALNGLGALDEATSTYKINAANVNVGTLDASVVNVINLSADNIESGSLSADRISGGTIDASDISGVTITGTTITGGSITGANILTAASGTRVDLSGSNIEFFSSAYTSGASRVGYIQGDDAGDAGLYIISDQGEIALDATNITLSGDTTVTGGLSVGDFLEVTGAFSPGSIDTGAITSTSLGTGAITSSSLGTGAVTASSVAVGTSNIGSNFINAESVGGGFANFTGSVTGQSGVISNGALTRTQLSGGGTTGASITDGGNFVRTSSSARYKTDIQPLELELADLYEVEPKTFKRIEEVEENSEEARVYPGFIAEELAGTSLDKFVFYSKDEQGNPRPEGIHYPELTAALLIAIKDLNARLTALEA